MRMDAEKVYRIIARQRCLDAHVFLNIGRVCTDMASVGADLVGRLAKIPAKKRMKILKESESETQWKGPSEYVLLGESPLILYLI